MDSEKVPDASQPKNEEVVREEKNDDEESYPPTKIVIPAIGAICLAIFLIALVSWSIPLSQRTRVEELN